MKILVTGSEGYLGLPLTQSLFAQGYEVEGYDTGFYRSTWLYNGIKKLPKVNSKDIRNVSLEDLKGFDAVVHLAELSNDPLGQMSREVTYGINHQGTVKLVKMCKEAGVRRFIYFSSCSVYGSTDTFADELSPVSPLTSYARCKILNEKTLLSLASDVFSPVVLRLSTAFGPSPRMRFDLVINNLSGLAWTTKKIKLESNGAPQRPFVHVEDICQAVKLILSSPRELTHKEIFNVGFNSSNFKIIEIAEIISDALPGCRISLNKKGIDVRNYRAKFDKIRRVFPEFECKIDIRHGIENLFKMYKLIGLSKDMFEAKEFTRIKQINYLRQTGQIDEKFYWHK